MSWTAIATAFTNMKPSEWASVITGVTGFVFALLSYRRSGLAESRSARAEAKSDETAKQARELNYAQEKQTALISLYQEEAANEMLGRRLHDAVERATRVRATEAVAMAKERLADVQGQAELLKAFREVIEKLPPQSASHEDLLALREVATKLKQLTAGQENSKDISNNLIAAIDETIEREQRGLRIFDSARDRVLSTTISNKMPVVLHEFRNILLQTKWAERGTTRPFFQKWLMRSPVELGIEALGVFTPDEIAALKEELRELTLG
jgi:hypothetical protein